MDEKVVDVVDTDGWKIAGDSKVSFMLLNDPNERLESGTGIETILLFLERHDILMRRSIVVAAVVFDDIIVASPFLSGSTISGTVLTLPVTPDGSTNRNDARRTGGQRRPSSFSCDPFSCLSFDGSSSLIGGLVAWLYCI